MIRVKPKSPGLFGIPGEQEFLSVWLPTLPQRPHIKIDDALAWREGVIGQDPKRFAWHFKRLTGIGGSEIGEVVQGFLGMPATFKTPWQIFAEKLMRKIPDPPNKNMRRGILMEPVIQNVFREDHDVKAVDGAILAIQSARIPEYPWMTGNTDDVVRFPDGRVAIVDYKSAGEVPEQSDLTYAAQLHLYDLLYARASGKLNTLSGDVFDQALERERPLGSDVLLNVFFDYPKGEAVPIEIPYTGQLTRAILDAGHEFWNGVIAGEMPRWTLDSDESEGGIIPLDEVSMDEFAELERQALTYKLVAENALEKYRSIADGMIGRLGEIAGGSLAGRKAPLQAFSLVVRLDVDKERWQDVRSNLGEIAGHETLRSTSAQSAPIDAGKLQEFLNGLSSAPEIDFFREYKPDTEKVSGFCRENGIQPPVRETAYLTPGKSKRVKALIDEARQEVDLAVSAVASQLLADVAAEEVELRLVA